LAAAAKQQAALMRQLVEAPALTRRAYRKQGSDGLRPAELQVLLAVVLEPDRLVGELVEQLAMDHATVSNGLAVLHQRKLVKQVVDKNDRRRRRQRPTAKGQRLAKRFVALSRG
jgi:DNA-binding MarR family transcriptional regulator